MQLSIAVGTFVAALAVAGTVSAQSAAPPKKPITHEALWMMKRVGAPVISPDGKWVVYSVNEPSYEKDKAVSDLWMVAADGSKPPRRITNTKAAEGGVAWSPDSSSIAFSTQREGDEVSQIYILNLAEGGEARRLTTVSTGADHPMWRPDGKAILFESTVYPNALDDEANKKIDKEHKDRKYNVRAYEHFPVRFWNQWLDERQPTLMIQSLDQTTAKDILSPTAFARAPGFFGSQADGGATLSSLWSPDGQEVLFVATQERWNSAFSNVAYHLYRMKADGGSEPKPVTPSGGDYGGASFSANGKTLLYQFSVQDQEVYNLTQLYQVPWPAGGEGTRVTRDFDRDTADYSVSADSKEVYLLSQDAGKELLYKVPVQGGKPVLVIAPATGGYTALAIAQKATKPVLVGSYGSSVSPSEIVRIDPAKQVHSNLTHVNTAAAAEIDWQPPQHFYFTSAKGRNIHNMVVLPPAFDASKKYPAIVLIHGGAASNNPDQIGLRWNYHLLASPGYVILMTDYTGSTSFGEKFAQAIKLDPLKTPGDEINQAVDEALKRYPFIDAAKLCAAGASYGGHLANWIEATTTRYQCIISHAGEVSLASQWGTSDGIYGREVTNGGPPWAGSPIWRDQSPLTYADHWKTPMLLSIGERDFRVPLNNTLENWSALQRMRVPSRLLVWPDAWHWILKPEDSRHFYAEVHQWLGQYLKGEKPTSAGGQ
jgi:dipeptidyl aminopeptidase/acylaminoacyl peptidase